MLLSPTLYIRTVALLLVAAMASCTSRPAGLKVELTGKAQGTTYSITYFEPSGASFQGAVDSLLAEIDQSLSTYVPGSLISRFNQADSFRTDDRLFVEMLQQSGRIYRLSEGAFDPTVMPLVKAWGFGPDDRLTPRIANLDSLRAFVGFDLLEISGFPDGQHEIRKAYPAMQLDFNAIAQGYSVDLLAELLASRGISDYLVELGGEVRARGKNETGEAWTLGVEKPIDIEGINELSAIIRLEDRAMATSGSYHRFYEQDGIRYSHTIDPHTGHPVRHTLLSVTVTAPDCVTADAMATAFMVMGLDKAKALLAANPDLGLEAYFISSATGFQFEEYATEGMKKIMEDL